MAEKKSATKGRRAGRKPAAIDLAAKRNGGSSTAGSDAVVGFESKLWEMADKLRNNMDAAEYKHVVLGLIFLKYISDAFEEKHAALAADSGADAEDRDEYAADAIFWVPKEARWPMLQGRPSSPRSANSSTKRCSRSSVTTRRSRACFPRTTRDRDSTRPASAS